MITGFLKSFQKSSQSHFCTDTTFRNSSVFYDLQTSSWRKGILFLHYDRSYHI